MTKYSKLSEAPVGSVIQITGTVVSGGCDHVIVSDGNDYGPVYLNPKRMVEVLSSPIVVGSRVRVMTSGTLGTVVWLDEDLDKWLVEIGTPRYVMLFRKNQIELA